MEIVKPLKGIPKATIFAAWHEAFKDYEAQWTDVQLEKMLHRRSYVQNLSFGAFDGEQLVSFILNGIEEIDGIKTAYDTGTGTIPSHRGKGLAARAFTESVPVLKNAGVKHYLLEVLQHNTPAVNIYKKQGFEISREFNYYRPAKDVLKSCNKVFPEGYTLRTIDIPAENEVAAMWNFKPSWQNSMTAVSKQPDDFTTIGVYYNDTLIAYGIIEPSTGDIPQLAVNHQHRRHGIGSVLLCQLNRLTHNALKITNTDATCISVNSFLEYHGIRKQGMQYEMVYNLMM